MFSNEFMQHDIFENQTSSFNSMKLKLKTENGKGRKVNLSFQHFIFKFFVTNLQATYIFH